MGARLTCCRFSSLPAPDYYWSPCRGAVVAKLDCEDLAARPPFVSIMVDYLPPAEAIKVGAAGVVVRLPADSSLIRIAAVAAYLGRLE